MTDTIRTLTLNALTSLKKDKPEINTSKSETAPKNHLLSHLVLQFSRVTKNSHCAPVAQWDIGKKEEISFCPSTDLGCLVMV